MMRIAINDRSDVTRLSLLLTVAALVFVTVVSLTIYPRSLWLWQIAVSWPLTTLITFTTTRMISLQLLEIGRLNAELHRLVSRDRLTNVATRDAFFNRLAERQHSAGIALMVDIDFFKKVNDSHGHLAGDAVIAHVATMLGQEVRVRDIVCRFGGEEFLVYLDGVDEPTAELVAERVRARVARSEITAEGRSIWVTVSIGVSRKLPVSDIQQAVRQADAALYRAKAAGRDCVILTPAEISTLDIRPKAS
ncbi:GGDEF domain-containing protein [Aliishimia ponticola]|uniref:diguanylate cyclase n=1 Tax=Aliishimia ponticola TaxID=2499833 RepID=A0A4S4ND60_9RHOB|nr:GGDEF domain-containing protein [Aliishimia ponticola]THH37414.1 GGDEF domain-containing protein [Aliishimia ponticola]